MQRDLYYFAVALFFVIYRFRTLYKLNNLLCPTYPTAHQLQSLTLEVLF